MKITLLTNKIFDSAEGENFADNASVARIGVSGGEDDSIDITIVVRNDAGAKLGQVSFSIKDDKAVVNN